MKPETAKGRAYYHTGIFVVHDLGGKNLGLKHALSLSTKGAKELIAYGQHIGGVNTTLYYLEYALAIELEIEKRFYWNLGAYGNALINAHLVEDYYGYGILLTPTISKSGLYNLMTAGVLTGIGFKADERFEIGVSSYYGITPLVKGYSVGELTTASVEFYANLVLFRKGVFQLKKKNKE